MTAADGNRASRTESGELAVYGSQGATSTNAGRYQPTDETERFWSKVAQIEGDGCWAWQGQLNKAGYGHFRRTLAPGVYQTVKAHRHAYEITRGPIGDGLTLDHLCGNPACVRPSHLEAVTRSENLRRRHARTRAAQNARNPFTDPATTERTITLLRRMYRRHRAAQQPDDAAA